MQSPTESVLAAVGAYLSWADSQEIESVVECATNGIAPAQFIIGCSLANAHPPQLDAAMSYMELAAAQGYKPALTKLSGTFKELTCELTC
jgi:hypothetical protein